MTDAGRAAATQGRVKVTVPLSPDVDGWPPGETENMWAEPLGNNCYKLINIPFFVQDLAYEDVVEARPDLDGRLVMKRKVSGSGRQTIWLIPMPDGPLGGDLTAAIEQFRPLGVDGEGAGQFGILALDVPPDVALRPVKDLLRAGERDGRWDYAEGCVSDEWLEL
jgi:hypothetical protein